MNGSQYQILIDMNKIKISCFSKSSRTHQFNDIYLYSYHTKKTYSLNNALHVIDFLINQDNFFDIMYNSFIDFSSYKFVYFRLGDMLYSLNLLKNNALLPSSSLTINIKTNPLSIDKIDNTEFVLNNIICQKRTYLNFQPNISFNIDESPIVFDSWFGDGLIKTSVSGNGAIACVTFNSHSATLCITIPASLCTKEKIVIASECSYTNFYNEIFQYNCNEIKPVFDTGKILTKHLLLSKECGIRTIQNSVIPITTDY
jgi:hypothetical protein